MDAFLFTVSEDATVQAEVTWSPSGAAPALYLGLHRESDRRVQGQWALSASGAAITLPVRVPAGRYFVSVGGAGSGPSTEVDYVLHVRTLPDAPPDLPAAPAYSEVDEAASSHRANDVLSLSWYPAPTVQQTAAEDAPEPTAVPLAAITVDPVCNGCQCPDPGGTPIQSYSTPGAGPCFGACGAGCNYCTSTTVRQCIDSGMSCEHCDCDHEEKECATHPECQAHDPCLAHCNASYPTRSLALAQCKLGCHASTGTTNWPTHVWNWLHGQGGTGTLTFTGPASGSGPQPGPCGGGSC